MLRNIHITHVMHTHLPAYSDVDSIDKEALEAIAYSQFNVIKTILSNPKALVLQESLYEDYTPDLSSKNQVVLQAKKIFPSGIPERFD